MLTLDDDQIGIAIDGVDRNVSPDDVEPRAMLLTALRFLDLVEAVAEYDGVDLGLHGLRIVDKCSAAVTRSYQPSVAERIAVEDVPRIMAELDLAPSPKVASAARDFRDQVVKLGPAVTVAAVGASRSAKVDIGAVPPPRTGYERITLRAFLLRAGGAKDATVQLQARGERKPFILHVDERLAMEMAPHLYQEIDIEARLQRRVADLSIATGKVTAFVPVRKGHGVDEWREYLRPASERLAGQDLEEKLKRG